MANITTQGRKGTIQRKKKEEQNSKADGEARDL